MEGSYLGALKIIKGENIQNSGRITNRKNTERQIQVGDEAGELNERIEGEASAIRRVLTPITRSIHPVSPPSYSSNFNASLLHKKL